MKGYAKGLVKFRNIYGFEVPYLWLVYPIIWLVYPILWLVYPIWPYVLKSHLSQKFEFYVLWTGNVFFLYLIKLTFAANFVSISLLVFFIWFFSSTIFLGGLVLPTLPYIFSWVGFCLDRHELSFQKICKRLTMTFSISYRGILGHRNHRLR